MDTNKLRKLAFIAGTPAMEQSILSYEQQLDAARSMLNKIDDFVFMDDLTDEEKSFVGRYADCVYSDRDTMQFVFDNYIENTKSEIDYLVQSVSDKEDFLYELDRIDGVS